MIFFRLRSGGFLSGVSPGATGIGDGLKEDKGDVLLIFSKNAGVKESNKTEVMAILEAPVILLFPDRLIVESDSSNTLSWISSIEGPWRFHFLFSEIKFLSSADLVESKHGVRLANSMADALAKQGVDRSIPFIAFIQ